jgi:hypothetical protein
MGFLTNHRNKKLLDLHSVGVDLHSGCAAYLKANHPEAVGLISQHQRIARMHGRNLNKLLKLVPSQQNRGTDPSVPAVIAPRVLRKYSEAKMDSDYLAKARAAQAASASAFRSDSKKEHEAAAYYHHEAEYHCKAKGNMRLARVHSYLANLHIARASK